MANHGRDLGGNLVKKPQPGLRRSIKLKFAKAGGHGKASVIADLNVTPMVDMLTMLVIFLLVSFTSSGEILFITKDIVLPKAYNAVALERAPVVAISASVIAMEGAALMPTEEANERTYKDGKLKPIVNKLKGMARDFKELYPDKPFDGQVIIQSDSNVPFAVISLVMISCAEAGYININYAVQKSGSVGGK